MSRRRQATLVAALAATAVAAACTREDDGPTPAEVRHAMALLEPPPGGPAADHLAADADRALDRHRRARDDAALAALEPGEGLEHATLSQIALDRGLFAGDALFVRGDELFDHAFRIEEGLGNNLARRPGVRAGSQPAPNQRRVHKGSFGGPDSTSCASCHSKGGPDGAGTATQIAFLRGDGRRTSSADARNPPLVLGLGPIELLAREMTADLARARDQAVAAASASGAAVEAPLDSKGVSFGVLVARPDGTVDLGAVHGVASDLVVRPFGWKGHQASLRAMIDESFRIHMGILSMPTTRRVEAGQLPRADYGDGRLADVDRDGVSPELDDGMLTTLSLYMAQLEVPVIRPPDDPALRADFARGRLLFDEVECGQCHRPSLDLSDPIFTTRAEAPEYADRAPASVDVAHDGDQPKIEAANVLADHYLVRLFSDLRRHDLGPGLASPPEGDIPGQVWLTRPLWGLASSAPYLHDGRAPTVDAAIRAHGGEAAPSRDLYVALDDDERAALLTFLHALTREPKLFVP